jgi:hypothetical protein
LRPIINLVSAAIDADQTGICGGIGRIINESAASPAGRAISFPSGARLQHLISVALARISLRIALIFRAIDAVARIFAAFGDGERQKT